MAERLKRHLLQLSISRCIAGEDKVGSLCLLVAGEAGLHECRISRFTVLEMPEPPASGCRVLRRVLDHELNVCGRSRNERLHFAKDLVVFIRRDVSVMQSGHDCAVRERELAFAIGLDRNIVAQNSA